MATNVASIASAPHGAKVLADVEAFLRRFVAYPCDNTLVAHVLWIAHAHCMEAWDSTPRIAFLSKEPGSGKTRALEATELLVPNPVEAVNVTPAYLFRKVGDESGLPTILFDEIDTVFGPKAKDNEEIRGLLNAGHRKGAKAGRCVVKGKRIETEEIPAYCAVAMAGLGNLPDTILARSVIVQMKRRAPDELVEPFRRRVHGPIGERLHDQISSWAASIVDAAAELYPDIPKEVQDRDADVWEPLIAIADLAGGDWPERARVSAVTLVTQSKDDTPSLGVRLLADIRDVWDSVRVPIQFDPSAMASKELVERLIAIEEAPWGNMRGKPLDPADLAKMLKGYGIQPKTVRILDKTHKGYRKEWFQDAWTRYLSPSL